MYLTYVLWKIRVLWYSYRSPVFMFCAAVLIFGGTKGVGSRFHVLRARIHFRRYRGRRVPFSCFDLPDSFSTVSSASGPVFMFCAPGLIIGGTEGVGSHFHVLRSWTHFRRCRGRQVSFERFALPDSFSAVLRESGPVFTFCVVGLIFGDTGDVGSRFLILLPDSFYTVPRASSLVLMFCAPGLIFGGTEGVPSHFHVFRSRTYFRRYRGRRVPSSCFALPDSFLAVPRA
jgi:hypothetical protein